ncbi:PAS domain S-box protein [Acidobacteria bacterium AH-259-O06]|nr:PAS domain S-box protein [Acidobacteria bacterium AH-259-O06]
MESEELYRTLVQTLSDPVVVIDVDGRIRRANKRIADLYGTENYNGVLGRQGLRFVAVGDRRKVVEKLREVFEKKATAVVEFGFVGPDRQLRDHVRDVEMSVSPIRDNTGEITSFIGVMRDISERRRLEEEIRIRQEAIESSIGAIIMADLQGKLKQANWSFLNLFGYNEEKEVLGKGFESFWTRKIPSNKIIETVHSEGMWRGELVGINQNNGEFFVDASISIILDVKDEPIGIVGFFNDITERKQTQEKMREASKMAALGEFVTGAAHEINNPIAIISGNAQYLLTKFDLKTMKETGSREFKKMKESLEMINKHSLRCGEITRKLLAFARGGEETAIKPVKLNSILNDVLSMVEHQLELSEITVRKQFGRLPLVEVDPSQMNQVFMNLILNAQQAMRKGGKLTIKTEAIDHNQVQVEVIDTGQGIPEQNLGRVFEPFFTTRQPGEGTGLGLAVTYSIIKAHGGDIKLKSKPGDGTKVMIELPVSTEP